MNVIVRNLLFSLLVLFHMNHCLADPIVWPLDRQLNRMECYSSLKEFFGNEIDGWRIQQYTGHENYTVAYDEGPARNAPSLYFKKINNKQCLILQVPFGGRAKFSPDGTLVEVNAGEIPGGAEDTGPYREITFKLDKEGFFIQSECRLNYFMDVASLSYPCDQEDPVGLNIDMGLPSFDCSKTHSKTENLICEDESLPVLDTVLNQNYKHIVSVLADKRAPVVAEQKAWIKQRNACKTKECLVESYKKRAHDLCAKYSSLFGKSDSGVLYNCVTFDQ